MTTPEPTAIEVLREALDQATRMLGLIETDADLAAQIHRVLHRCETNVLPALASELEAADAVNDRIRTILDEAVSMMPVMPAQEALTLLEEHVHSLRMAVEIAQRREPTQAEGDAHEWRKPSGAPDDGGDGPPDECYVPAGGWTGRRCRVCNRWVWGGPTACVGCVTLAEREARIRELEAALLCECKRAADLVRQLEARRAVPEGELAEQREKLWTLIRNYRGEHVGDLVGVAGAIDRILEPLFGTASAWARLQWRKASEAPIGELVLAHVGGIITSGALELGRRLSYGGWVFVGYRGDVEERHVLGWLPLDALPPTEEGDHD